MKNLIANIDFFGPEVVWGIDLLFEEQETLCINLLQLSKKEGKVEIIRRHAGVDKLETAIEIMGTKYPALLSVRGKGILHKEIDVFEGDQEISPERLVQKYLPDIQEADFEKQLNPGGETTQHISLIRKEKIQYLHDEFSAQGVIILDFTLGPFKLNSIASWLDQSHIMVPGSFEVEVSDGHVTQIKKSAEKDLNSGYTVDTEVLESHEIIPYATALSFFLSIYSADSNQMQYNREEQKFKKWFRQVGILSVATIFIILLLNTLVYGQLNKKYAALNISYTENKALFSEYQELSKELKSKKTYLSEDQGMRSLISFYSDRITRILPGKLVLNELAVYPVQQKIRRSDPLACQNDLIEVKGNAQTLQDLNSYIGKLREEVWIDELIIKNIKQDNLSSEVQFELHIKRK